MKKSLFKTPSKPAWSFDSALKPSKKKLLASPFTLIPAEAVDIQKVVLAYQHHPIDNYDIVSVDIILNYPLNQAFKGTIPLLNTRANNPKYVPTWEKACQGKELAMRQQVVLLYQQLTVPYRDSRFPNVHLLPLWHGTNDNVAEHIFKGGYGIFTSNDPNFVTDDGFFGKGIYSAYEAEYAFRCYAAKHGQEAVLILNWVSFFTAYPVINGDMDKLRGQMGGYAQCDAHFAPVRSDDHPNTDVYYPCKENEQHQYTEIVVFNEAQCLPRYRVKVQKRQIMPQLFIPGVEIHHMGLVALQRYDYLFVQLAFEKAANYACPLSLVRLHWITLGGAEVLPSHVELASTWANRLREATKELLHYANPLILNDAEAQFALGWCYAEGLGVEKDMAEAAKYYWLAAQQHHTDALYQLGKCYSTGSGTEKNLDLAIVFYQQAANQGHAHANYILAQIYTLGLGIEPQPALATHYRLAAEKAKHPAVSQTVLSLVSLQPETPTEPPRPPSPSAEDYYRRGIDYEKTKAYTDAASAYQKATDKGHTKARTNLGLFFAAGRGGCTRDPQKAYTLWKQSAEEGHDRAMLNLANQLKKGYGVPVDLETAEQWETKAKGLQGK